MVFGWLPFIYGRLSMTLYFQVWKHRLRQPRFSTVVSPVSRHSTASELSARNTRSGHPRLPLSCLQRFPQRHSNPNRPAAVQLPHSACRLAAYKRLSSSAPRLGGPQLFNHEVSVKRSLNLEIQDGLTEYVQLRKRMTTSRGILLFGTPTRLLCATPTIITLSSHIWKV